MSKELVVLTLHGMGDTPRDYWRAIEKGLRKEIKDSEWGRIDFRPIYYQDVIQGSQSEVWGRMRTSDLEWPGLRKFALYGLSDAATLEHRADMEDSPYERVQKLILETLMQCYDRVGQKAVPVVLLAQSLGCQVISNFIWDAWAPSPKRGVWARDFTDGFGKRSARGRFLRLRTTRAFITVGCNIPLFVAGHNPIVAIKPPRNLRWINFYDDDDVLGWPLKPLSESYEEVVTKDERVNVGGFFKSWNPLSHTGYWKSNSVMEPISAEILRLLE